MSSVRRLSRQFPWSAICPSPPIGRLMIRLFAKISSDRGCKANANPGETQRDPPNATVRAKNLVPNNLRLHLEYRPGAFRSHSCYGWTSRGLTKPFHSGCARIDIWKHDTIEKESLRRSG